MRKKNRKQNEKIIILTKPLDVAKYVADRFLSIGAGNKLNKYPFHISLSGGHTPVIVFTLLSQEPYCSQVLWSKLHFWWGDERCVPPKDPQSNYGVAYDKLFCHINIPAENIHRICGETDPLQESARYSEELRGTIPGGDIPALDWTLLGLGDDGHTASLFPEGVDLNLSEITAVALHPESGQKRITMSARLLCASKRITFLVTGENKALKTREILKKEPSAAAYPAFHIKSLVGNTEWVLDEDAAKRLIE